MISLLEYHRPDSLTQALQLLSRKGLRTVPLGGGTGIVAGSRQDIEAIVDLALLPLHYIESDADGLRIGGLCRLGDLCSSPGIAAFAGGLLAAAARRAGTSLLRNQATLAGTILTPEAGPELCAALLVLEAEIVLHRIENTSVLPLGSLYKNPAAGIEGAILGEIRVPPVPADVRPGSERVSRTPESPPIVSVVALTHIEGERIAECRIAATGIGRHPARLASLEKLLRNAPADPESIAALARESVNRLELFNDGDASAAYRRAVLPVLIRRATAFE